MNKSSVRWSVTSWKPSAWAGAGIVVVLAVLWACLAHAATEAESGRLAATADSWPTYLADSSRSGVSPQGPDLPLQQHWAYTPPAVPKPAWAPPRDVPVEGVLELPRVRYDDAFHVAAVNGVVYFGSFSDNKVYALDAATGKVRWEFFTGGPVRLAPTLHRGRVYVGSDDGHVYCLKADDGELLWDFRAAPTDEMVLGSGKMISLWPVRTGVLIYDDAAYFACGIFPGERVFLYSVRADTGELIWKNDTVSDAGAGQNGFTPQGYLLATDKYIYVPSGRALPTCFDRATGRYKYQASGSWRSVGVVGGTYALLFGDHLYSGTEMQVVTLDKKSGRMGFAWFPGKRLVVTERISYMLNTVGIKALDRIAYPEASRNRRAVKNKRTALTRQRPRPEDFNEQLKAIQQEEDEAAAAVEACTKWQLEHEGLDSMIVAGKYLFAGGGNEALAIDRESGTVVWTGAVTGRARGLAVAGGRLFVSTDLGTIHCFGKGGPPADAASWERARDPYPRDKYTRLYGRAARAIVEQTGVKKGYCLVLGCGTGRLAYELAKRTDLMIYGVEPDAEKVKIARKALDKAGLYGTRVCIEQASLGQAPYSDYFANLIVSDEALVSGTLSTPAAEALRMLKPCGGVVYLGQPEGISPSLSLNRLKAWLIPELEGAEVETEGGAWAKYVRGQIPGAGSWTHQYGEPGNTASSEETALKCPLGVLWYGEPGPDKVPSRHARNAAPLTINGRVYLQGINRIMCFDAFNGLPYWEREIKGAYRVGVSHECSNIACTEDSLFVGAGPECLRLDAATGETIAKYKTPPTEDGKHPNWAYVAVADGLLFGSAATKRGWCDSVFAFEIETGERRWTHKGTGIWNNSIAMSDGRVFFADNRATPEQRQQALQKRAAELREAAEAKAAAAKSAPDKSWEGKPLYAAPRISPDLDGDLSDWGKVTPVALPLSGKAPRFYADWKGKKDLSARFYLGWDERNLYFAAAVTDDVFHQPFAGDNIWEADCIQMAMDILRTGSYDREYGLALAPSGPFTWCWYGPATDAGKIRLETKKRSDGVDYEAAIPWELLGAFSPAAGKAIGFTAAVMDSDGSEREGDVEWTRGIVDGKDASAFGTVLLVGTQNEAEVRAAREKLAPPTEVDKELARTDLRTAVALDAATGKMLWETPVDLTDCTGIGPGGGALIGMCSNGVLVFAGAHADGHYWQQFLGGEFAKRRAVALSMQDGAPLWSKAIGCRIRPMIVGDTLYAEPWAFDIHTGEQKMRTHPLTGRETIWELERPGHHCGCISGCPNALFYRSWSTAYYDLVRDFGTEHFGGQRPGCWINMIPANGLLVVPEASSGCICLHSITCTVVFKPRKTDKAWGVYASRGEMMPIKRININLGGPGDRADAKGNLWLSYPRPGGRMRLTFKLALKILPDCGYFKEPAEYCDVRGTDEPWLYSSGCTGVTSCSVPLVRPGDGDAVYTVRLGFATLDEDRPGQRVFDVKLQGETVEEGFDLVHAAGGARCVIVKEYKDIPVQDSLKIELIPKLEKPDKDHAPILNTIEIIRERVLSVGMTQPSFELSDPVPEQAADVRIANNTDKAFEGTLQVSAPELFAVTPAATNVALASGEEMTVELAVKRKEKGKRGDYTVDMKLVRADGTIEIERRAPLQYLGPKARMVIKAAEDTFVRKGAATQNYGSGTTMAVDGGGEKMGDESHSFGYLKFPLNIPGKALSVTLRLRTTDAGHSQSGDSGRIYLVEEPWQEGKLTYNTQPKRGKEVANLGKVGHDVWEERTLQVDLRGMKELSLVIAPTSCDGATYWARESPQGPELVVEYEVPEE